MIYIQVPTKVLDFEVNSKLLILSLNQNLPKLRRKIKNIKLSPQGVNKSFSALPGVRLLQVCVVRGILHAKVVSF